MSGNRGQCNHPVVEKFKLGITIIVLVLIIGAVVLFSTNTNSDTTLNTFHNDLPAGRSQAFLILANGKKITPTGAVRVRRRT